MCSLQEVALNSDVSRFSVLEVWVPGGSGGDYGEEGLWAGCVYEAYACVFLRGYELHAYRGQ